MNNRPDRLYSIMGQFDPTYPVYEHPFQQSFPRPSGTPPHFDNMGYWYGPDPQEPLFEHNALLYNPGLPMSNSPLDQPVNVKHRRTRSGCFTCRHRRVKCDETRPICERCRKGNRECQFPQPSTSARRVDSGGPRSSYAKPANQEQKAGLARQLSAIEDESEDEKEESMSPPAASSRSGAGLAQMQTSRSMDHYRRLRRKSDVTDFNEERDSPLSIETTSQQSRTGTPVSTSHTPPLAQRHSPHLQGWKHLDVDIQRHLRFHRDCVTRFHYFIKSDPEDFIHTEFIDMALSFEPLLYAIVGFAAYHHTLGKPDGRFQEFWKYYCRSIELLREWLQSHTERNEAALLTILQLATFEEYLGDWASVASHQKAAYSIFSALYTYDNVMSTTASRCIFDWLARVDVALSLMGGQTAVLERQWFVTALAWYKARAASGGQNSSPTPTLLVAKLGLIGFDMATVFAAGAAAKSNTAHNIRNITKRLGSLRQDIEALHAKTHSSESSQSSSKQSSITGNVSIPLFEDDLWQLNFLWVDWYATEQMHRYQTMLHTRLIQAKSSSRDQYTQTSTCIGDSGFESLPPELEKSSLAQCQLYEAIEKSPNAPYGSILGCQASLALACVFMEKTPKYTLWARSKLASIERMGYVWPPKFRKQMSQIWGDEGVLEWWLPDGKHKIELLDQIREVAEERNKLIEGQGGDDRDDVREIKAVFDKLDFGRRITRTRKDSVWSATGNEAEKLIRANSADESSDEEDGHELENGPGILYVREGSRDSGIDAHSNTSTRPDQPPPSLEYSTRMSGIWEGPAQPGQ